MAIAILPIKIETIVFGMAFSSWRVLLIVNLFLAISALIGLIFLPETPKYVLMQGDHDGALNILSQIYAKNTGNSAENYPVKHLVLQAGGANIKNIHGIKDALKMIWSQTIPMFHKERLLHTINICVSMFLIYAIAQGTFMW